MLTTKIKASSITNLTDARYFAAWMIDWMGFDLTIGSETYVSPQTIQAIHGWVDGVEKIGEFSLQEADEILSAIDMLTLDGVQLGMFTDLATMEKVHKKVPIIKEIVIDQESTSQWLKDHLTQMAPFTDKFLLNFDKNALSWEAVKRSSKIKIEDLQDIFQQYPILLSIDVNASNVQEIIEELRPLGLNVKGGDEERVGVKSYDELDQLFEVLEE